MSRSIAVIAVIAVVLGGLLGYRWLMRRRQSKRSGETYPFW
jgi:hypothetical protein